MTLPSRGRWILVGVTLVTWSVILVLFVTYGYEKTWKLWNVPVLPPPFADFRLLPGSAESIRRGFDPTVENPGDPHGRIYNYPALWSLLFYTNITQADTIWMSISMLTLFFVAVFVFPGALSGVDAVLMLLVLFSPAAMLLYERGNVDALMFVVCALGLVALEASAGLAAFVFLLGAMLKIFPFFGLIVFVKKGGKAFARWLVTLTLIFLAYLAATAKSVSAGWNLTQRGSDISYGANVLFLKFGAAFDDTLSGWLTKADAHRSLIVGPYVLACAVILIATTLAMQAGRDVSVRSQRNLDAFRIGSAIYIGTFLFGNNWDYRLVFLLLVMPQLSQWMRDSTGRVRVISGCAVVAILLSCWYLLIGYSADCPNPCGIRAKPLFFLDECVNWSLMASLVYLLVTSMPEWVKPASPIRVE